MNDQTSFETLWAGGFNGVLRWPQLDALWEAVRTTGAWYVYQVGEELPAEPLEGEALARVLAELDALLKKEHEHDYCGIVYADSLETPQLVKVYDPNHLGASCGSSGLKILPRWIISRPAPSHIEETAPVPANRRRWWQRLLPG
ncbi:MAG: hypothetical protein PHQ14_00625 [Chromatiales bacterium]|nr:hypothetical protein [Chromatiales bacterium]